MSPSLQTTLRSTVAVALLVLPLGALASLYDAEEIAYLRYLDSARVSHHCRAVLENSYDQQKYSAVRDPRKLSDTQRSMAQLIAAIRNVAKNNLSRVEVALPPESLRESYVVRLEFLRYAHGIPDAPKPDQVDELVERCRKLYLNAISTLQWFTTRNAQYPTRGTLRLTYEPPLIPITYDLLSGSFTVKKSLSTPLGSLTAGYTNTSGAKLLIIRSDGRERYFSLDQPFEVFLPASHGVAVKSDANGTIVLEVLKR
jgi:hypothetical protein